MDAINNSQPNQKKISIVFSFRNEEENIPELILRVNSTFADLPFEYEMIFVNDASTDRSLEILMKHRREDSRIKILNMSRRFGVHPCVIAGIGASTGDAIVYMDADLQDPPELIPRLIEEWLKGADVVHTKRNKRYGESRVKLAITMLAYKIIDRIAEIKIPTNCGDFKLLSRRAAQEIMKINENNPFMRGLTYWIGFSQAFVEYNRDSRFKGKTHFSILGLGPMKEFERGVITFSTFPLKIALILGFFTSLFAFFYLPILIACKFLGYNLPGWTAIMCATVFFNGMVLFTVGILGLYIGRIYNEVRGRPQYIICEKIGFDPAADPSPANIEKFKSDNLSETTCIYTNNV